MLNHDWGKEAFVRFPELIDRFDHVENPHELWFQLTDAFDEANKPPRNEDLIARIYAFAEWCCLQPQGATAEDDLGSCVCVCFYEHIPECPEALEDMPRWFSRSEVMQMKATFSYMVGEDGFGRILEAYERHSRQANAKSRHRR